ncbi:MAG: response regulator [Flavobacteriales bacterium]|nr:response regulator [Flavobacteriales bacterium]
MQPIRMNTPASLVEDRANVLFIDGNATNRQTFASAFACDFDVRLAGSMEEAWEILAEGRTDVVICEQLLPGILGSDALGQVKQRHPRAKRMLITEHADLRSLVDALNNAGVCHYISKPWEVDAVRTAVRDAHASLQAQDAQSALTSQLLESNRQLEFALRQRLLS